MALEQVLHFEHHLLKGNDMVVLAREAADLAEELRKRGGKVCGLEVSEFGGMVRFRVESDDELMD